MLKQKSFILSFATVAFLIGTPLAHSQDEIVDTPPVESPIDQELVDSELGATEEAPPAPESPYPGAKEEGVVQTSPAEDEAVTTAAPTDLERPVKIDPDSGDYYYDTRRTPAAAPVSREADLTPTAIKDNGDYIYDRKSRVVEFSGRENVERPTEILASGEFKYSTEKSPTSGTASFRVGFFGPPKLVNRDTHKSFQDIYTKDQLPVLFGEYEWPLTTKLGHIGVKFGSGLFLAQGNGVFKVDDRGRRADDIPPEKYTFLMFPNQLTAQYRFQYSDNQAVVPYVEGGFGYFTFIEMRDDNSTPRIGGAATTVLAAGANFLVDWLDPDAIQRLDSDYGINHVFLTTEFRQIVGLNQNYDFSSSVINAGFLFQF